VSYWIDNDDMRIHVVNRSLDPVQDVRVWFSILGFPRMKGVDPKYAAVNFAIFLRGIPPCSEVLFERDNFRWTAKPEKYSVPRHPLVASYEGTRGYRKMINDGNVDSFHLSFVDRDGVAWERNYDAGLKLAEGSVSGLYSGERAMVGTLMDYPPVKPLGNCKDG
jgi:hypothetical protein